MWPENSPAAGLLCAQVFFSLFQTQFSFQIKLCGAGGDVGLRWGSTAGNLARGLFGEGTVGLVLTSHAGWGWRGQAVKFRWMLLVIS